MGSVLYNKSGFDIHVPRILYWRKDKPMEEADTLENLQLLLKIIQC